MSLVYRFANFTFAIVALCMAEPTRADDLWPNSRGSTSPFGYAISTSGATGALHLPDARTLLEGTVIVGFNNSKDADFYWAARAENYQFGIGLFPFVELSGRLANFPLDREGTLGQRDLSANFKFSVPKLFRYQPDIAFGINDLGGGAIFFESKYVVIGENFGPLRIDVGSARGRPYLGRYFGSAEVALGRSGFSALVERNNGGYSTGLRYGSVPVSMLGNARVVATVQRAFGARSPDGAIYPNQSFSFNLVLPLGEKPGKSRRLPPESEPIWIPPAAYVAGAKLANGAMQDSGVPGQAGSRPDPALRGNGIATVPAIEGLNEIAASKIREELIKAGLERVRIGIEGRKLIVEFENHRYNQNEVDAIGLALGVASLTVPDGIERIAVVAKKAKLALYMVSVDQASYRNFMRDGDANEVKTLLTFHYHPAYSEEVRWFDSEDGARGYSRFRIEPSLLKFVATDVGVLDFSLAADIQGFVPLWKGAELTTSYISSLAETKNIAHGIFGFAQQRSGLRTAVLTQTLFATDQALNITSAGKLLYDFAGIQNETVLFVPGRDDQLRLKYSYLRQSEESATKAGLRGGAPYLSRNTISGGAISYLWNFQPLNISVDTSYNKYIGGDTGPTVQVNRWFGDVQAQLFVRKSNIQTLVGFGLAFPITPRQGMKFGVSHIEGPGSFPLRLETRYARLGQCNCITNGVVQEIPLVYSSTSNLLNQGRIGRVYLLSQLQRMREAAFLYSNLAQ